MWQGRMVIWTRGSESASYIIQDCGWPSNKLSREVMTVCEMSSVEVQGVY